MIRIPLLKYTELWQDDLCCGCPDQASRAFDWKGERHELYLRWRWDDPWQGHVIRKDQHWDDGVWSPDLFELASMNISHDRVDRAKVEIERLARAFLDNPTWK